jgi:hypothetical protein
MRTIKQLPEESPIIDNENFTDGSIKNQTESEQGTPVVEEIIGDPLSNIYKLLRQSKITPNGLQDNELNGYQLIEALKLFSNSLNDEEKILSLDGTVFSIPVNLSLLPNKYPIFVRASESYNPALTYTFKGNGTGDDNLIYDFTGTSFSSGDELLLIIDSAGVRFYNLSSLSSTPKEIFPSMSVPLCFNDSGVIWYYSEGTLFSEQMNSYNILNSIVDFYATACEVCEAFIRLGYVYFMVYISVTETYRICRFSLGDLNTCESVNIEGIPLGENNNPYLFTDGINVWLTNSSGNSEDDFELDKYSFVGQNLVYVSSVTMDENFVKTRNFCIKNNNLFTMVSNQLRQCSLSTGITVFGSNYKGSVGVLFSYNKQAYFLVGEVAKKWDLPILT